MQILAFTGAGISKASGIPTFEDMGELRECLSRDFATKHPQKYNHIIKNMYETCENASPNDGHYALVQYQIPVITMNIDGLHKKSGHPEVMEIHGSLPTKDELSNASLLTGKPVLYGDIAPLYQEAMNRVSKLTFGDIFLMIGVSGYTAIAYSLKEIAYFNGAKIVEINEDAEHKVREFLSQTLGGEK